MLPHLNAAGYVSSYVFPMCRRQEGRVGLAGYSGMSGPISCYRTAGGMILWKGCFRLLTKWRCSCGAVSDEITVRWGSGGLSASGFYRRAKGFIGERGFYRPLVCRLIGTLIQGLRLGLQTSRRRTLADKTLSRNVSRQAAGCLDTAALTHLERSWVEGPTQLLPQGRIQPRRGASARQLHIHSC